MLLLLQETEETPRSPEAAVIVLALARPKPTACIVNTLPLQLAPLSFLSLCVSLSLSLSLLKVKQQRHLFTPCLAKLLVVRFDVLVATRRRNIQV